MASRILNTGCAALALTAIWLSASAPAGAADLVTKDGAGVIRVSPYPVSASFQNTSGSTPQQDAFWARATEGINYMASSTGTSYGSRYFENEKSSYPKAMYSYVYGLANNNPTHTSAAKSFLTATASNGEDGGNIGGVQNTDRIDLFPSFTLKGQMPKYFWFGLYSGQVLGTTNG